MITKLNLDFDLFVKQNYTLVDFKNRIKKDWKLMKIKYELTLLIEQIFKLDIFGVKIHIFRLENSVPKKIQKFKKKNLSE